MISNWTDNNQTQLYLSSLCFSSCFSEVHGGAPGANSYSLTQAGVSSAGSLLCGVSSPISLRQGNPHPQPQPHQTPYPPPPPLGLLRHNNYPCLGQQHHQQNQNQQQQNHIKPEHRGNYAPGWADWVGSGRRWIKGFIEYVEGGGAIRATHVFTWLCVDGNSWCV